MLARIVDVIQSQKQRVIYTVITFFLLTVLKLGHATHWSFAGSGEHIHSADLAPTLAPDTEVPETVGAPAAPALEGNGNKREIRITDQITREAGIRVEQAANRAIRDILTVNGVTGYDQDRVAQLSVRTPGHVWRVEKRIGESIRKGDCLAIIDAVQVGEAKTEFLQAVVNLELKAKTLERLRRVVNEVAERTLHQAEAEEREARLRMLSAQQKLINLGLPLKADAVNACSDAELVARIRVIGLPPSIVAMLDPETTTANLIPLTAPFDGIVIGRAATVGETVSPTSAQFTIADIDHMWITLDVRKEHAGLIRLGQSMDFLADGASAHVGGTIDWISTELNEETRTLSVRASVQNPPIDKGSGTVSRRLLTANTFGVGRIVLGESPQAVAVPTASIQFDGTRHFVFVRTTAGFVRRDVRLGTAENGFTEICEGLTAGESIAVAGSHVLKAELVSLTAQ